MIVLDASAWIDVLTAGLDLVELEDDDIIVPPHFDVEVMGSIRALVQRREIELQVADVAIDRHLRAQFTRVFDPEDARRAWALRDSLSFTDAWYVALARRLGATWITADQRAGRTARRLDITVSIV